MGAVSLAAADALLEARDLQFRWPRAAAPCLDIAHFAIAPGEAVFLHGPSGSGKSTLLSLMAGVLLASGGQVRLRGQDWAALRSTARDAHRVAHVGY
ncbi:MAG: ATP-binding cassette domain-containing protein, partial [Comamonadaceae bacterium]